MKTCNGIKRTNMAEAMQITKLEPVIIEVEKDGRCLSHLILFEMKYNLLFNKDEMTVDGDIRELIFEVNERNFD